MAEAPNGGKLQLASSERECGEKSGRNATGEAEGNMEEEKTNKKPEGGKRNVGTKSLTTTEKERGGPTLTELKGSGRKKPQTLNNGKGKHAGEEEEKVRAATRKANSKKRQRRWATSPQSWEK